MKGQAAPQAQGTATINAVAPPTYRICIEVVDDQDKPQPLAGIEVVYDHKTTAVASKTTCKKGRVWIDHLATGALKIRALKGEKTYEVVSCQSKALPPDTAPGDASPANPTIEALISREAAKTKHTVKSGDTLETIAQQYGLKDWRALAVYNWGATDPREVSRALIEYVGCSKLLADPSNSVLEPPPKQKVELLIPQSWSSDKLAALAGGLALETLHVIKLRPIRPPTAIRIDKLDRWFIPAAEPCDINYGLEGLKDCADKVEFDVFGSHYAKCKDWKKGLGEFEPLDGQPLFSKPADNEAGERKSAPIEIEGPDPADPLKKKKEAWKGQVTTAEGVLGVKADPKDVRYINVAFSPYTAHLRYYKTGEANDQKARLELLPFWPLWEETKTEPATTVTGDVAKVKLEWTNAADAHWGLLTIKDKGGQVVFHTALEGDLLKKGKRTFDWDRRYNTQQVNSARRHHYSKADSPYTYEVKTVSGGAKTVLAGWWKTTVNEDQFKITIKWENAADYSLDANTTGELTVTDCRDTVVHKVAFAARNAKLAAGAQSVDWNGKYDGATKNSAGGKEYFPGDGPYVYKIAIKTVHRPTGVNVSGGPEANVTANWTNAADRDSGTLQVLDRTGAVVVTAALAGDELKAGARRKSVALNPYVDASARYKVRIVTNKGAATTQHSPSGGDLLITRRVTIKWSNVSWIDSGTIEIKQGGSLLRPAVQVHKADLAGNQLNQGNAEFKWDGCDVSKNYNYTVTTIREYKPEGADVPRTPGHVSIRWNNGSAILAGSALLVRDKGGQLVYFEELAGGNLAAGAQTVDWNKVYSNWAHNSQKHRFHLRSDGAYSYSILSLTGAPVPATPAVTAHDADKIKIAWENAAAADRGVLIVTDKDGQIVYAQALAADKLTKAKHEVEWNLAYRPSAWNSCLGQEYRPADGPYKYAVTTFVRKLSRSVRTKDPKAAPIDPLKIEWRVLETERLESGQLLIFDGKDRVVFRTALTKDQLQPDKSAKKPLATQSFVWKDGKYSHGAKNSKNGDDAIPDDMPYRVQIQAHTGVNKAKGLALVAMHTEVRLAVAPGTLDPVTPGYEPTADADSLTLSLGPDFAGKEPADTEDLFYEMKLAGAGYHPGPVRGAGHAQRALAIQEFQRSVPKNDAAPFTRLNVNGNPADADTRTRIKTHAAGYRRPRFSNPNDANLAAFDETKDAERKTLNETLAKPGESLILWVDARHYYTRSRTPANQNLIVIGDYHGEFTCGDTLETLDRGATCRPWIPLVAAPRLLSKSKGLNDPLEAEPADAKLRQAMRQAIGPLRIDWSFVEPGPDLGGIEKLTYDANRVRSLGYLQWALKDRAAWHDRRDTQQKALLTNCPKDNGGIRAAPAEYFKQAFGHGDTESYWPWQAVSDDPEEALVTAVHDLLIGSQKKDIDKAQGEPIYPGWLGCAGVYFRPSIVAGDAYRVCARIRFAAAGDYKFDNLAVLAARYPRLPQAHTAALRIWRRTAVRGHVLWSPNASKAAQIAGMNTAYHAAHVHFIPDVANAVTTYRPKTDLIGAPQEAAFKDVIKNRVAQAHHKTPGMVAKIKFDDSYCYPWFDEDDLGWPWLTDAGATWNSAVALIDWIETDTWARFQEALLLKLIERIEEKDGKLRGHLLSQFVDTRPCVVRQYVCRDCGTQFWHMERTNATRSGDNRNCKVCPGQVHAARWQGTYQCANGHNPVGWEDTSAGGRYNGDPCPTCNQPLNLVPPVVVAVAERRLNPAPRSIVNYGVGSAGGGTWLPDGFVGWEWAHEVGHHRHMEHAASAPVGTRGPQRDKLHDSEDNAQADFSWTDTAAVQHAGDEIAQLDLRWDRCCIMSYVDSSVGYQNAPQDETAFCGKCLLRNSGWKVETLGHPPSDQTDG